MPNKEINKTQSQSHTHTLHRLSHPWHIVVSLFLHRAATDSPFQYLQDEDTLLQEFMDINQLLLIKAQQLPPCPYRTNVVTVASYRLSLQGTATQIVTSVQLGTLEELVQQGYYELERMEQQVKMKSQTN